MQPTFAATMESVGSAQKKTRGPQDGERQDAKCRPAFGRTSEKTDPDQFDPALEDLETAMAVVHAEDEADTRAGNRIAKPRAINRCSLPKHLPRVEEVIELESLICSCGGCLHCIDERIGELYRIEAELRGLDPGARLAGRQKRSSPLVADVQAWLIHHRARVATKSPLGEALAYIAKYRNGLRLYLTDGRIEIDNNSVERTIRPIALRAASDRKPLSHQPQTNGNYAKLPVAGRNLRSSTVGDLLQFLGDVLGNMMSGHRSKSRFVRWLERAVMVIVAALIALVIYRVYSS